MAVPTHSAEVERLTVVETGRRRRWSEDEKLRIVTESLRGPRLVSLTARRYGISRGLLGTWCRRFRVERRTEGETGPRFVPAVVVAEPPAGSRSLAASGRMEIVALSGRRVIVDPGVDAGALARVLDVVERR
jgi:transposase